MTETISEEARRLLDALPPRPWQVRSLPNGEGDEPTLMIGTIRDASGQPVVAAHPESFTMLVGQPEFFEFLIKAVGYAEHIANEGEKTPNKPNSVRTTLESGE